MANDEDKDWKISDTDNNRSFPLGAIQKFKKNPKDGSYELKWRAGAVDCAFFPLFADPLDSNILRNPRAKGRYGDFETTYDVTVVISPDQTQSDKATFSGTSAEAMKMANTPGPLVGQWGAETPPPPGMVPARRGRGSIAIDNDR